LASRIEDYALIGNCRTAALVAKTGSIDWLCLPRFDSGACCAALLGTEEHGRWHVAPREPVINVRRRYLPGTPVLETVMETASGEVALIDFMSPLSRDADLYRLVRGVRGEVPMVSELSVRFDYGSMVPWVQRIDRGIRATAGPDSIYYRSDLRMEVHHQTATSNFAIGAGQQTALQLSWTATHEPAPAEKNVPTALADTVAWWQDWTGRSSYRGLWPRAVQRSLITLKSLTYAPTGGIVAAPTTSLPEQIGGVRNWDYRFCWLRDATFTLYSLLVGGYTEEARAWRHWLVNAAAGSPAQLQIMYGVAGERRLPEFEVDWLPGYENSRPVRIGNAAYRQHQLDVSGEIMEALHLARRYGLEASEDAWRVQLAVVKFLEGVWTEPDEGIWEIRGPRRHFTHSKVMAWVAVDRMVKDVEHFNLPGDVEHWRALRDRIHAEVIELGFNTKVGAFTQSYGSDEPDASLLMLPLVSFIDANDPRMQGTIELIERRLVRDGFVSRYPTETNVDGLPEGEGAFLLCSFWLADNYALAGRMTEARELFQMLLDLRNDVGLLSEEYDPRAGRMIGNFPQAFSHVGLVNTARNLTGAGGPAEERGSEDSDFWSPGQ
jgi:GH15 family glucan-1,4-alpha-glucosidase